MALLSAQEITVAGVAVTTATPAASDTFVNTGTEMIYVNNGSGSQITVTVSTPGKYLGATITAQAVTIANGAAKYIKPYKPEITQDPSTGVSTVTCSATSSVTIAIIQFKA